MPIRRFFILTFLLAVISLGLLAGCEEKPESPTFNNPFDPAGDTSDPFDLIATYSGGNITLVWTELLGYGITTYDVLHSPSFTGEFFSIGSVEAGSPMLFNYQDAEPTSSHYFKIQAFDATGGFTAHSSIVPASVRAPALLTVGETGTTRAASRHIQLYITVSQGDSLRISQVGRPDSEVVIATAEAGVPAILDWDLGEVAQNDTTLTVQVAVQYGTTVTDTATAPLIVDFEPSLGLARGGTKVGSLSPELSINTEGLVSMRFAGTLEGLADQNWIPGLHVYNQFSLEDTTEPQDIFAEFLGDFGFTTTALLTVTADPLTDAGFYLALPESHITDQRDVQVVNNAVATQMRFAESLDFAGASWESYSDTTTITLSEGGGEKTIYVQFRNDFSQSGIYTDYAIFVSQPVAIAFTAPAESDTLVSGTTLQAQGTTTAPSGTAPVDSVKFDGGEGWVDVWGTTNWRVFYTAPTVEEATDYVLRARAWAAGDSTTTAVNITVLPAESR